MPVIAILISCLFFRRCENEELDLNAAKGTVPWPRHLDFVEKTMKLVPVGEKIIVKRLDAEEKTTGGIMLPDSAKKKPWQGRVLSVGDGCLMPDGTRAAHQVSEGDRVMFGSYAGTEVKVNGEELLIMSENEVLAVVL
jgi:chaperonin GroES